ncbi:hypothetical protein MSP8886_01528 [Marinomonas spartinae]|uniref:Endonuclease/exonuclease/phosphatase domain-containing protein n=1 Tax=Marinomonas spartinae TaxID=1792290 RepID=A0A1A8TB83_9GAMM|nr:endonuclease/exonuclease/phosphatase family protein [Marinomonas spartinae]SBS29373.1 hypothetical protein MSP8886_01528 [Marinomonas spartinae]
MMKSRYRKIESLKVMGSASKAVMGPNIDVLLWNVFKCRREGWQEDFQTLIHDKDLVLLQEAVFNSPFDVIFSQSTQHQWIMARSFKNLQTSIETGIKTGSSVTANKHFCSASPYSEPITKTKKMLLATEYPITSAESSFLESSLLVVNTHIINFVSLRKFKTHLDQVFQVLKHHNGPIILAGDFNTWNGKRLAYFNSLAMSLFLEEVKLIRQPRLSHFFKHLDHVYCRGLDVVDVHVHTDIHSSDHFPISLSLKIVASR